MNTLFVNSCTQDVKSCTQDVDVPEIQEYNPYNMNNREIQLEHIISILNKYNVPCERLHNIKLFRRAFIHKSYVKKSDKENSQNNIVLAPCPEGCLKLSTKSNERLEFLGDGILDCITKYYLYRRFPKENEGFMTEKKIALVRNEHIGKLAQEMGLQNWFIISKHAEEKGIRNNIKKLGCLFEAFLGALFLDFNKISVKDEDKWFENVFVSGPGFQMAQMFVESVFEKHVNWTKLILEDTNYKNQLQIKIQKEYKVTPEYCVIHEDENTYHVGVYLAIQYPKQNMCHENATPLTSLPIYGEDSTCFICLGEGKHKVKKKAEQEASMNAIRAIALQGL